MNLQQEWDFTNRHLDWLNRRFVSLHEKNQKEWGDAERRAASEYRDSAIATGQHRYWILQRAREQQIKLK